MRIGLLWDSEYPWDVRVEKICRSFIASGQEVHLICRNRTAQARYEVDNGLHIHRLPNAGKHMDGVASFPFFGNPVWLYAIRRVVISHHLESLIVRDIPMALAGILIGAIRQIPCYIDMAEPYPEMLAGYKSLQKARFSKKMMNGVLRNPQLAQKVETLACRLAAHIFPVSDEMRKNLIRKRVPANKITVVHNTPLLSDFPSGSNPQQNDPRYSEDRQQLTVTYIGDLTEARGLPLVIEVMARLKRFRSSICLVIIGGGRFEQRVHQLIKMHGLEDCIRCTGWLAHRQAYEQMLRADIGLIPHLETAHNHLTVPNKVFDYMAGHLPVVSAKLSSLDRILSATGAGLVLKEYTADSFVDTLMQLRDPNFRFKLGWRGRKAFEQEYNWERDFSNLYRVVTDRAV
jgi:glycosyltransferase involved in cell wall biosynthesis